MKISAKSFNLILFLTAVLCGVLLLFSNAAFAEETGTASDIDLVSDSKTENTVSTDETVISDSDFILPADDETTIAETPAQELSTSDSAEEPVTPVSDDETSGQIVFITPEYIEDGTQAGDPDKSDFNGDGKIDSLDVEYFMLHVYFPEKFPVGKGIDCDLNCDGVVNDSDVTCFIREYSILMPQTGVSFAEAQKVLDTIPDGTVMISNCGQDENGKYHGGKAGDQTGNEWRIRTWYNNSNGWDCVLRYTGEKQEEVSAMIAQMAYLAANNNNIGYDQDQRTTFWAELSKVGYNPSMILTPCEADCSSGVAAIIKAVGYVLNLRKLKDVSSEMYTGNEKAVLANAGFTVYTSSDFTKSGTYLMAGDVLLSIGHHTTIVISDGAKAGEVNTAPAVRVDIKKGSKNDTVRELQNALNDLGYTDNSGARLDTDGSFGNKTQEALDNFRQANGIEEKPDSAYVYKDGVTWQVIDEMLVGQAVTVSSDEANIRAQASINSDPVAVVTRGTVLVYTRIFYNESEDRNMYYIPALGGWISEKCLAL